MSYVKPNAFAFLVGINDYSAFDASGAHDLHGAIRDVQHYWRMAKAAGIPPENIRIACAPMKQVEVADGTVCTGATLADIQAGLDWLASKLTTSKVSAGLLSISAHGSYDAARGSLICASDTRDEGDALSGTLPMTELFGRLADRAPQTPITIFLDACDAGAGPDGEGDTGRAIRGRAPTNIKPAELKRRPDDLLLAASAPGSESYEIRVDDSTRGAFSWAALALLERWGLHRTEADTHFDITYGDLQRRIDGLLDAMRVPQQSHFDANPAQRARKVFAELRGIGLGEPDRPYYTGGREVSPGANGYVREYTVSLVDGQTSTLKARLWAPGDGCGNWKSGEMYWEKVDGWDSFFEGLGGLGGSKKLKIHFSKDHEAGGLGDPDSSFTSYETGPAWILRSAPSYGSGDHFGYFWFGGKKCYLCADQQGRLTWLLDENVTPPSTGWLVDNSNSTKLKIYHQASAPSATQYYEADD